MTGSRPVVVLARISQRLARLLAAPQPPQVRAWTIARSGPPPA